MSKYNLTDILNEYVGGGRIGTLNISFRNLVDRMEELEKSDEVIVREKSGPSGDGKVNREFEVVARDSAVPGGNEQERGFTVYDYKFGFDPGDIDNYEEEYDFSVGGNDIDLAMKLINDIKPFRIGENVKENMYIDDEEFKMEMGRSKKDSLKKEMMIHVDQLIDGNIDMNDFMNVVEDVMAEVNSMKEGMSDEEFADAKEKERLEKHPERDKIKAIQALLAKEVMGVDRKGRKKSDYKSNLTNIDEADNMEIVTILNNVRKHLVDKFDRRYSKPEFDLYMDSLERDMRRSEKEFDEVKSYSMEDHEAGFEYYIADRYDDIREDFKRFM